MCFSHSSCFPLQVDISSLDVLRLLRTTLLRYDRYGVGGALSAQHQRNCMNTERNWIARNALALLFAFLYFVFYAIGLFEPLEMHALDRRYRIRGARPAPENVILVAIDDSTYRELNLSYLHALPRHYLSEVTAKLKAVGVKRISFDFIIRDWHDNEEDWNLVDSLKSMPTIIGQDSYVRTRKNLHGEPEQYQELMIPNTHFAEAATEVASIRFYQDDQTVRRFTPYFSKDGEFGRSLAAAGVDYSAPESERPSEIDFIDYYGKSPALRTIPLQEVLKLPEEELRPLMQDRYVFIGVQRAIAAGDRPKDAFFTPYGQLTYGVEIHAVAAANLLEGRWINRLTLDQEITLLSVGAFVGSLLLFVSSPSIGLLLLFLFWILWLWIGQITFNYGFFLPGASLVFGFFGFVYVVNSLHHYLVELRDRKEVEGAFSRYVSPNMLREVKKLHGKLKLGGSRVEATALFTDLAGFTTYAENKNPEAVAKILNVYFSSIAKIALDEKGTLIRFTGDGMFVLFGAPVAFDDHPNRAVHVACRIQQAVRELQERGEMPTLITRIGIHAGSMLVGNLGSIERHDYTAIGDTVNIASRLEGACKNLGLETLVSGSVTSVAAASERLLPLGDILVAGKQDALEISGLFYEIVPNSFREQWMLFVSAVRSRDLEDARERLGELEGWTPMTTVVSIYQKMLAETAGENSLYIDFSTIK